MGDFYQHGVVTTLHQLSERPLEALERELMNFRKQRPMALILPSLYSELEGPALSSILDELTPVPYLDQIVVGLDRADTQQYKHALSFFNRLPQRPSVMWHDGPRLRKIDAVLQSHGLAPDQPGKGRNVWYMFGYILATNKAQAVALHDCDITTYNRDMLARLIYPVANPSFSFKFCKGYYARVANHAINGRVCRLLVTPLLRALKKVCGPNNYLDYLDSFRYALAGEFSLQRDVIEDIRIPSDWGLEMGVLSEMHRNYATNQICQVDIADTYDHKHQDLSPDDRSRGLSKMSSDIAKSLFRKMATQGEVFATERIRTIKATYYRIALDLVESFSADASINGLRYDRHSEGKAVEMFSENIMRAGEEFLEKSMDTPFMPSWKRVQAAVPDIMDQLVQAVEADTQEFGSDQVVIPALHPEAQRLRHRIELHLREIYGDTGANGKSPVQLSDGLLSVAGLEGHAPVPADKVNKWSNEDIVLITYGDSIIENKENQNGQDVHREQPLRSLHRFLNRELKSTITGVHILPFSPYSSDDGFSVIDYNQINPELGTWHDIQSIAEEYVIMADLVINHCSSQSLWFQNFKEGRNPGKDYFITASETDDISQVVRPRATPLLTKVETVAGEKQVWCTFSPDQVDLNYANPDVLFEVIKLLRDYVQHGIKYFRLDAVAFLWKEIGTECVHLPQTHEIIKLIRLVLENLDPACVVITETNVPNRENLSYFGNDNEAHLIYNFSLPPLLINSLLTGDCKHLKTWMMSMPPARRGRAYLNFIASHDGIGVRPAEGLLSETELDDMLKTLESFGGTISMRQMPDGDQKPYEVNISLYDALKGTVKHSKQALIGNAAPDNSSIDVLNQSIEGDQYQFDRFICAHTIMLALEGLPGIYIHSMLATENDYERKESTGHARSINRHQWEAGDLNDALNNEDKHHGKVFEELKRLVQIRREQQAFHPNATQYTLHFGDSVFAFWRESLERDQSIFAVHNISDKPQHIPLVELNLIGTERWKDLITDTVYQDLEEVIELPPYGCVWITNKS